MEGGTRGAYGSGVLSAKNLFDRDRKRFRDLARERRVRIGSARLNGVNRLLRDVEHRSEVTLRPATGDAQLTYPGVWGKPDEMVVCHGLLVSFPTPIPPRPDA